MLHGENMLCRRLYAGHWKKKRLDFYNDWLDFYNIELDFYNVWLDFYNTG